MSAMPACLNRTWVGTGLSRHCRGSTSAPCKAAQTAWGWRGAAHARGVGERGQAVVVAKAEAPSVHTPSQSISVEEAWALLLELTQKEARGLGQQMLNSPEKRARLRDALLVAAACPRVPAGWDPSREPREVLLGLVTSDVRLGVRALRDYCQALGLPFIVPESRVPGCPALPSISGAVYIKYNSATGLCYASRYEGRDRGVLVQLGQQQVGHLPLGLMDEAMANAAPQL